MLSRSLSFILCLKFLMLLTAECQNKSVALLAFRIATNKSWVFRSDENPLMDHDKTLRITGTIVAARFCSTQSGKSNTKLYRQQLAGVMNFLKTSYGYNSDRFLILQRAACRGSGDSVVELWVVPKGAVLPEGTKISDGHELSEIDSEN